MLSIDSGVGICGYYKFFHYESFVIAYLGALIDFVVFGA